MDPLTWKKEGVSSHWSGSRGFRKACCKVRQAQVSVSKLEPKRGCNIAPSAQVCCVDRVCAGCRDCLCKQGPIRGGYDGMVVLACITKDCIPRCSLPTTPTTPRVMQGRLDQEDLGIALEAGLGLHFMQEGGELGGRAVHAGRERFLGETSPKLGKPKKHPAYCVYLAYRLDRAVAGEEGEGSTATPTSVGWEEEEEDEEVQQVMEELEDKQLLGRLTTVEQENKELREVSGGVR